MLHVFAIAVLLFFCFAISAPPHCISEKWVIYHFPQKHYSMVAIELNSAELTHPLPIRSLGEVVAVMKCSPSAHHSK